ncbi:SUF system NifU family Fe-S cluster assembly protein [Paenibacillus glucanolyticus]|jgi:nitrogen fixation NifU-like protein|uniref:Fe-S cluster assembly sulfur transfer protein SufU n=1 Tax=Paenibacillus TaxID=44249 RepID=UPI0003E26E42|nr:MULTISPECIES: SUF system NifU family Fe-S cluster assembly protein [Paenibacillus]ANA78944.1 iron-sulfur cluster assembly scaffold protein NifU [Paenibacillus glucanolyticus]AVV57138.1 SUF system NifU family Fe-S cluster assembly protein [Paenibacillus glucanolyticus]ETT32172.1 SUF system FeS assembly protein, NifU family [Paenibacillus sp. FSL R5-808]MPY16617.1 SUF system NifU family Fe-S cluster assembly protein [Paenibacillus glucanolyticus]OMF74601.1 SUF system NifU family Fe-S cluster 
MQLDDLYRRVIMDHYKNPRNRGKFDEDAVTIDLNNPTCGDRISLQLKVENGVVADAKYTGEGCSISMSSASMMTDAVKGKSLDEAISLANRFSSLMKGEAVEFEEYEDIEALSGVNKFPARIKCATLAWNALRKGIDAK